MESFGFIIMAASVVVMFQLSITAHYGEETKKRLDRIVALLDQREAANK